MDETSDADVERAGGAPALTKRSERGRRHLSLGRETMLLLGFALVLAIVIKALFVQAFYIPSESMEPGLIEDDRILVQKVSYWGNGSPQRGDIVVFEDPGDWLSPSQQTHKSPLVSLMATVGLYPEGKHLVKRVVGIEGDTIVCCDKQGRISVNGSPLDEGDYIERQEDCNGPMTNTCDWASGPVPAGHIFVMGDNRDDSRDSTVHMCGEDETRCAPGDEFVDTDLVVGRLVALVWPADRFTFEDRPDAFESVPDPS